MRPLVIPRGVLGTAPLEGRVLCHDLRDAEGRVALRKGQVLDAQAASRLSSLPWAEIHVLELEPGDLHEEAAGARLAQAAAGPGAAVAGYGGGQWTLAAARRGLLRVRVDALAGANGEPGVSVFTLYDLQPVEPGEAIARAKITPLAIAEATLARAEDRARRADGLVAVDGFRPSLIGALAREGLEPRQRARFEASLGEKIAWFGARLLPVRYSGGDASAVAAALHRLVDAGAEILVVAGASALDPLDAVFAGLARAGARMERHGAPAHPGSLLWLATLAGRPVLGMPTCGMFSEATTFDLVLPRILTGEPVGGRELAALGHGGLLSRESAYRFPPYRKSAARGELPD